MDRKERFNVAYKFLYDKGWIHSQKEAAKKMETTAPNMSSALNGVESVLTDKFLKRFADAFPAISTDWLLNESGAMLTMENNIVKSHNSGVPYYNVDFEMGFDLLVNDQSRLSDRLPSI